MDINYDYRGQLTRLGCEVDQASNGLIAVQRMKLTPPPHYDIILLDLEMPIKGKTGTLDNKILI